MESTALKEMRVIKAHKCQQRGCGLGAASTAPNKKRLAQMLATAPSPAFYWAPKKPHVTVGGFFGAWPKVGEEGWEGGYLWASA